MESVENSTTGQTNVEPVTQPSIQVEQVAAPEPVAPIVNDRLLAESKEWKLKAQSSKKELAAMKEQLAGIERAKAEEQGQYKELYLKEKTRREEVEGSMVKAYVGNAVKAAASKLGCVDPEVALQLGNSSNLQFDEGSGEVHGVDQFLEELQKSKPFLFVAAKTPTINPTVPGGVPSVETVDTSKMTMDEHKDYVKSQLKRLGGSPFE